MFPEFDTSYMGSGRYLKRSIKVHGIDNFTKEILEVCTKENINEREIFWIKELDSMNPEVGYNLCEGGGGANGLKFSKESLIKLSESHKGQIPWNKGYECSDEHKRNLSISLIGRKLPDSVCKKMSKSRFGTTRSIETCNKISESHKRENLSSETRLRRSNSAKLRIYSEETRIKMSNSAKLRREREAQLCQAI